VGGLNPKRSREMLFFHNEKGLGYHAEIRGDTKGPLTIKLQPLGSASGRIVDKAGQPLAGLALAPYTLGSPYGQVKTDKDGRFKVEGLVPGATYRLYPIESTKRRAIRQTFVVEPAKDKDLGDIIDPNE
jgi:hypothetical protein